MLSKSFLLVFLTVCTYSPLSAQQSLASFSSDITYTVNGERHTGKVYSDGHSLRLESEYGVPSHARIALLQLDSGLIQVFMPGLNAYSEYPYGAPWAAQFGRFRRDAKAKIEPIGKEDVDGKKCEKVRATATYGAHSYSIIEWRSRELNGFVLRSQDVQNQWSIEFRNVHPGTQRISLFQIPVDYTRILYSQDWTSVVRQIQAADALLDKMLVARKGGLDVVGGDGVAVREITEYSPALLTVRFIDPVTRTDVYFGPQVYSTAP